MTVRRVLLHNHSTWSDGKMSLDAVVRLGERLDAAAIVMSEHDYHFTHDKWDSYVEACSAASTGKCQLIPGIEYSSPDDRLHVLAVGSSKFHGARNDILETLTAVRESNGANILAHPLRKKAVEAVTKETLDLLDAIEIWNRKADGLAPVKDHVFFAKDHRLAMTLGMDLHTYRQAFPMWNEIETDSKRLTGPLIATAIKEQKIVPACIFGKIGPDVDGSMIIRLLNSAEMCRRLLRDARDGFNFRTK
jgi:predicted metal-dependent phosphoesterase TrpH